MKKRLFLIASCLCMALCMFAQNSEIEMITDGPKTEFEKFLNSCRYTRVDYVEKYSTAHCRIEAMIVTDIESGKKAGGVKIYAKSALQILSGYGDHEAPCIGYFDLSEISDVVAVLNDVLVENKKKAEFPYYILYESISGVEILWDQNNGEFYLSHSYIGSNSYGTPVKYRISTPDLGLNEVNRISKKLVDAKTKMEAQIAK